jgi:G3E family GTPase
MTVNQDGQEVTEWLEVGNGCICCSVKYSISLKDLSKSILTHTRDSGVMAIESLMERRGTFDYILLETTGLADPGNIAPIFWVDDNLGSSIYLDGIVTLVDAKNILHLLDQPTPEEIVPDDHDHGHDHSGPILSMAHMQISHADVIILNKTDLVTAEELEAVRDRVTAINSAAKIHVTDHSRTPQIEGVVLDLHAYDHLDSLDFSQKGHSHIDPVRFPLSSVHYTCEESANKKSQKAISTIALTHPPLSQSQIPRVDEWLRSILWDSTLPSPSSQTTNSEPTSKRPDFEIHRLKGILALSDGSSKIIQAVRDVFEIRDEERSPDDERKSQCKLVLIGRGLGDVGPWQESFEEFVVRDE